MLQGGMNRIRVGVIGLGRFGEVHCEALSGLETVQLKALSTRTRDRLGALGARFGVTKLYPDYRDMLADPEIDAVSVVTMWDHIQAMSFKVCKLKIIFNHKIYNIMEKKH